MKGDYLGFSFDGHHSSSLNIVRVSDGDRYKEELFPELENNSLAIPGRDGEFYFGSNFKSKTISIDIAFDRMTEVNFRKMQRLFSVKKPCKLIFDEKPYKVYTAKIEEPIELEYICFDEPYSYEGEEQDGIRVISREGDTIIREKITPIITDSSRTQRIYKGEGTISFICFSPFAKSQFKTLEEYENYNNIEEWAAASGILAQEEYVNRGLDVVHIVTPEEAQTQEFVGYNAYIPVYNAGDIDASFYLYLPYSIVGSYNYGQLEPDSGEEILIDMDDASLVLNPFTSRKHMISENGIIINTNNHLIEGVVYNLDGSWTTTGEIYNNYIVGGDFGKILCTDYNLDNRIRQSIKINCKTAAGARVSYNYLYY